MNYHFRTPTHPEANGRHPRVGEESFVLMYPTDEGGMVSIELGRADWIHAAATIVKMLDDHAELGHEVAYAMEKVKKMEIDE